MARIQAEIDRWSTPPVRTQAQRFGYDPPSINLVQGATGPDHGVFLGILNSLPGLSVQ